MRLSASLVGVLLLIVPIPVSGGPQAPPPPLSILDPGSVGFFFRVLPVNVVFVGYEEGVGAEEIDRDHFLEGLPGVTAGLAILPALYGVLRPSYIAWQLQYDLRFAGQGFEDAFFDFLLASGVERAPTVVQQFYNADPASSMAITGDILEIDAVATERWLAEHAPGMLAVDTTKPTVFFINWHGRQDFRFHVYGKTGEPDVDTGVDFGRRDSRKIIAWGGTPPGDPGGEVRRVWFHDLSAGPDFFTGNWNLSDPDMDFDNVLDYRMPPVWEYGGTDGYRPFTDLSGDLAKVLRYVAIDTLFAPSPIYEPVLSAPKLPGEIGATVNRYVDAGLSPTSLSEQDVKGSLSRLQPWNTFTITQRQSPFEGQLAKVHGCFASSFTDPTFVGESCYGRRASGFSYWDLLLYLWDHRLQLTDLAHEYSVPVLFFELQDLPVPIRGNASENFPDGSQAYVLMYTTPDLEAQGFGATELLTHEVGHHVGLAHPHDGVDFEEGIVFLQTGDFFFAWTGTESSTVMSYMSVEHDFSQFDLDSMGRWMAVGYLNETNQVLAEIFDSPKARSEDAAVVAADQDAIAAVVAYTQMDYQAAASSAKRAYEGLLAAAARLGIPIEPQAKPADLKARSPNRFFVDPVVPPFGERPAAPQGPPAVSLPFDVHVPDQPTGWVYAPG